MYHNGSGLLERGPLFCDIRSVVYVPVCYERIDPSEWRVKKELGMQSQC
jgi:hypothetical protein